MKNFMKIVFIVLIIVGLVSCDKMKSFFSSETGNKLTQGEIEQELQDLKKQGKEPLYPHSDEFKISGKLHGLKYFDYQKNCQECHKTWTISDNTEWELSKEEKEYIGDCSRCHNTFPLKHKEDTFKSKNKNGNFHGRMFFKDRSECYMCHKEVYEYTFKSEKSLKEKKVLVENNKEEAASKKERKQCQFCHEYPHPKLWASGDRHGIKFQDSVYYYSVNKLIADGEFNTNSPAINGYYDVNNKMNNENYKYCDHCHHAEKKKANSTEISQAKNLFVDRNPKNHVSCVLCHNRIHHENPDTYYEGHGDNVYKLKYVQCITCHNSSDLNIRINVGIKNEDGKKIKNIFPSFYDDFIKGDAMCVDCHDGKEKEWMIRIKNEGYREEASLLKKDDTLKAKIFKVTPPKKGSKVTSEVSSEFSSEEGQKQGDSKKGQDKIEVRALSSSHDGDNGKKIDPDKKDPNVELNEDKKRIEAKKKIASNF